MGHDSVSTPIAASDTFWPMLYRFIDESTQELAKFVIWRRDSTSWATSYMSYFNNSQSTTFRRFVQLSYGMGCHSELDVPHLARAYDAHSQSVLDYFNATDQ